MHFLRSKIKRLNIGWNERVLTEDDFYQICRANKIRVEEMPLTVAGFYYRVKGIDSIVVDSKLRGTRRLAVMFHELGHFFFHAPDSGATANFHGVGRPTRKECEADIFALCALIPRKMVESHECGELIGMGYDEDQVAARLAIYEKHGL